MYTSPLELSNRVLWTYTYMYMYTQVHWNLVTERYGHTHIYVCTYRSTETQQILHKSTFKELKHVLSIVNGL